jgi:hypothetical protein
MVLNCNGKMVFLLKMPLIRSLLKNIYAFAATIWLLISGFGYKYQTGMR